MALAILEFRDDTADSCFHPMWWGVAGIVGVDILQTSTIIHEPVALIDSRLSSGILLFFGLLFLHLVEDAAV